MNGQRFRGGNSTVDRRYIGQATCKTAYITFAADVHRGIIESAVQQQAFGVHAGQLCFDVQCAGKRAFNYIITGKTHKAACKGFGDYGVVAAGDGAIFDDRPNLFTSETASVILIFSACTKITV